MTDNEMANIVELATQQIVGDRQELTEDECKRITWLVAEMLTVNTEEGKQS